MFPPQCKLLARMKLKVANPPLGKRGDNFEAVSRKDGKEWGVKIDPNGNVLSKHKREDRKGGEILIG
jgi:hypothetical protein